MEQITNEQPADATAVDVLAAVIGDKPQDARSVLADLSFRDRALLTAWFEEAARLVGDEQRRYETRERTASRAAPRPLAADERATLAGIVREHLRSRVADGRDWTDLRDIVLAVAPYTLAGDAAVRDWARGHVEDLVRGGTLSPKSPFAIDGPAEYRIVTVPGQDKSNA